MTHESVATSAREDVESVQLWYHTIDVAPGVTTPGWFDLRPIVDRLPWPDVSGKRCLDVGPWDGFLTFELERRGASEVVAADIGGPAEWDLPAYRRDAQVRSMTESSGERTGRGFEVARRLLGSRAERVEISAYDLTPERVGTFDIVTCGSLLLHLRDPVRALEAMRGVCREKFLSAEQIRLGLSLLRRQQPLAEVVAGRRGQWWVPNVAGHRALVAAAGFEIERTIRPYAIPLGAAHPGREGGGLGSRLITRLATRGPGIPHSAALATPL